MALKKASSSDLEITLKNMLDGLMKDVDMLKVDDAKLQQLVKSRQESFLSIKEMLGLWQNSPNAPKEEKLIYYTEKLILGGEKSSHILRQALIKKIDFNELDPEKYGLAMKSKPIVYKAISDINSGVNILKRQIETNTLSFKEQEFKPGMAERYANQEFFPEKSDGKYFPNDQEIKTMWLEVGEQCTTSIPFGGRTIEGRTYNDTKSGLFPKKSWDPNKKRDFLLTIKNHIKSKELTSKQVGNDLEIICNDKMIAQVMFRDSYVGVRAKGAKFADEFEYTELGKIKAKISEIVKDCK